MPGFPLLLPQRGVNLLSFGARACVARPRDDDNDDASSPPRLPIVTLLGFAFPGIAQMIFAYVHVSDVVEASEPTWVRNVFIKEASWAHHHSVIARLNIVIPLDIEAEVHNIHHETLLVYGTNDTFTGDTSKKLAQLLPNARLAPLPGGHLPHLTSPRAFADLAATFLLDAK